MLLSNNKKSMRKIFVEGENVIVNHHIDFHFGCDACRGHDFTTSLLQSIGK